MKCKQGENRVHKGEKSHQSFFPACVAAAPRTRLNHLYQQESKNHTTFCPHAFRAKGDSRVSRVPCGRFREGAPG